MSTSYKKDIKLDLAVTTGLMIASIALGSVMGMVLSAVLYFSIFRG